MITFKIKTNIYDCTQQWIPQCKNWSGFPLISNEAVNQDALSKRVARYCIKNMDSTNDEQSESARKVISVNNMVYEGGNHYIRNAMENEFFTELSTQENPASLKKHLGFIFKESKQGYLRNILEN